MRAHPRTLTFAAAAAAVAAGAALVAPAVADKADVRRDDSVDTVRNEMHFWDVKAPTDAAVQRLNSAGFDVMEHRSGPMVRIVGDATTGDKLKAAGFQATFSHQYTSAWKNPGGVLDDNGNRRVGVVPADTFFGGYHTITGHMNYLTQIAKDKPDLVKSFQIGKSQSGQFPIQAVCITKDAASNCQQTPTSTKGRFMLMTQTHAREIASGEMAYKFMEEVLAGYGTNADITAMLEANELWIVPTANPDGHDYMASGGRPNMQRKNRNSTNGNCSGTGIGVDLNRNNGSHWGVVDKPNDPCADNYPGPRADSEPENQALQSLWKSIFPDSRADGDSAVAPDTTPGYMLSIHSVVGANLFPWAYTRSHAPNDKGLRTIMKNAAKHNSYKVGQVSEVLYTASGGHDDWIYDKLGTAAATIELGGSGQCNEFHAPYSCVATYWKQNGPVLHYLAKIAKQPYTMGMGAVVREVTVKPDGTVDASVSAAAVPGAERKVGQTVVEYSLDAGFKDAHRMTLGAKRSAADTVRASASLSAGERTGGRKLVYVRAKDATTGKYGPTTAAWVNG